MRKLLILREPKLRLPAGQTENRDGSGRESGRFRAFRLMATRSTGGRNPAWCGDFRQEKGPGDYPGPCVWWWNTEPNPRPLSEPDSNTLALRAWIRRFGHRHCSESKSNSSQSLPDQRKPSSSGMADAPFGRIEKCRLFPVVLSDQVAWHVPHWQ